MSGIISAPQFYRVFPDLDPAVTSPSHSSLMQAFYTAIYEIGCLAGAIWALVMGNKLGRRKNILLGCTILSIGAIIQVTAMPGYVLSSFTRNLTLMNPVAQTSGGTSVRHWADRHWIWNWCEYGDDPVVASRVLEIA